jgi:ankyrin repeat protein
MKHSSKFAVLLAFIVIAVALVAWGLTVFSGNDAKRIERAVLNDDADEVDELLKRGFDPNFPFRRSKGGQSETRLLHYAVMCGSRMALKRLLDHGADPNLRDFSGKLPLMVLFSHGVTDDFVEGGMFGDLFPVTDLSIVDKSGNSVLHYIAYYGSDKYYSAVIRRYPSLEELKNNAGKTPKEIHDRRSVPNGTSGGGP